MKTAFSLILSASIALAACAPGRTTAGDNNVAIAAVSVEVSEAQPGGEIASNDADDTSEEPVALGGMCTGPSRCPPNYEYIPWPKCSCVPKPKPAPKL